MHVKRFTNIYTNIFFFFSQRVNKMLKKSLEVEREILSLMHLKISKYSKYKVMNESVTI